MALHGAGDFLNVGQDALRCGREEDSFAGADKQLAAQLFLQLLDSLGQGGLGGEEALRRLGDVLGFGQHLNQFTVFLVQFLASFFY